MNPILSILIALRDHQAPIEQCLASLEPQFDDRVEVVIADGSPTGVGEVLGARFPWIRVHRCSVMNAGKLRRDAFLASHGRLVALAEPHIVFAQDWVAAALTVEWRSGSVVGGAVTLGSCPGIGRRAAFLCEYADFLPPLVEGYSLLTTGNNVIYRRSALEQCDLSDGLWKAWVNDTLRQRGFVFWSDPALVVQHNREYEFRAFLFKRFHHGRSYSTKRSQGWGLFRRLAYALAAVAIPWVFGLRTTRSLLGKRAYLCWLLVAQPWLLVFNAAWSAGEACGYLFGEGSSGQHLY